MTSPKKGLLFFGNAYPSSAQDLEDLHPGLKLQTNPTYKHDSLSDLDSQESFTNDDSSDNTSTGIPHHRLSCDQMHENGEKARPLKLFQYLTNFENDQKGDSKGQAPIILSSQHAERTSHTKKAVLSLENIGAEAISTRRPSVEEQACSQPTIEKPVEKESVRVSRKGFKLGLVSQFRRKSCHCSECGGVSKFEMKVQNIVEAPTEQIKMVRYLREKNNPRDNKKPPFLDLPQMSALMLSENGQEGSKRQSLVTKKQSKKLQKHMRIQSIIACFTGRKSILHRGTETPFRKSRQEIIEEQVLKSEHGQFTVRISKPGETEKHLHEGEKRGSLRREAFDKNDIIVPVLGKKSKNMKQIKRKNKKESGASTEIHLPPMIISHSDNKSHEINKTDSPTFTGTSMKKFTFKAAEYEEMMQPIQSVDEVLDKQTKREVLDKVGVISPKFKAIVSPRTRRTDESDKQKRLSTIVSRYSPPKMSPKMKGPYLVGGSQKKITSSTSTIDSQNAVDHACTLGRVQSDATCCGLTSPAIQRTKPRMNTIEPKILSARDSLVIQDLKSIYSPTASARHSKYYSISNGLQSRQSIQVKGSPSNMSASLTFWPNTARDLKNTNDKKLLTQSHEVTNKNTVIRIKKKSQTDKVKLNHVGSQKEIVWCK